jgi:hypothetical protein
MVNNIKYNQTLHILFIVVHHHVPSQLKPKVIIIIRHELIVEEIVFGQRWKQACDSWVA